MGLQDEIDAKRSEIRTDGYSMSIGELISLYEHEEIDIHPEFQRFFRWDIWQKSRLIESLLLGIPIPQIFVYQREDGVWDVVDGLQRLATIFQFVGILQDANKNVLKPLVLEGTRYLPALKGVRWGVDSLYRQKRSSSEEDLPPEDTGATTKTLTSMQRLLIKRSKILVSIILKESDEQNKFELFERLNTGGSSLSGQELRNCILVSLNPDIYKWLRELANDKNFISCTNLTDRAINEQYDVELAFRFLVFYNMDNKHLKGIGDLDEFLTEETRKMANSKEFDVEEVGKHFKKTFELLMSHSEGDSFRKFDAAKRRFTGGFLVSAFEAVALGIGYNLNNIGEQQIDIKGKIEQLWQMQEFKDIAGSGINASRRISKVLPLARKLFKP